MRYLAAAIVVLLATTTARADVTAEVTKDYTAWITDLAAGKQPGVEIFVGPEGDSAHTDTFDDLGKLLVKHQLSGITVVPAKSGSSAWLVADLAAQAPATKKAVTVRTSAFLVHDDKGWHVRAAHWSVARVDDVMPPEMGCGMLGFEWELAGHPAKDADPIAKTAIAALHDSKLTSLLSDDKRAIVIGSAPKERFTGGAAIKKVFAKWELFSPYTADERPVYAGVGPGGDLAWIVLPVTGPPKVCTQYRALWVLQKEGASWKLVHQHYSLPARY
jgi:hypothetical protein